MPTVTHAFTLCEAKVAFAEYCQMKYGVEVNPNDVHFNIGQGDAGDPREPSGPYITSVEVKSSGKKHKVYRGSDMVAQMADQPADSDRRGG